MTLCLRLRAAGRRASRRLVSEDFGVLLQAASNTASGSNALHNDSEHERSIKQIQPGKKYGKHPPPRTGSGTRRE